MLENDLFEFGKKDANVLVICDPPSKLAMQSKKPITAEQKLVFDKIAVAFDLPRSEFAFLNCSNFMDDTTYTSVSKQGKHLESVREPFLQKFAQYTPKVVLTLGALAARQVYGRAIQITKARGVYQQYNISPVPVLHTYSMGYVIKNPQYVSTLNADFLMLAKFFENNQSTQGIGIAKDLNYQWCTDLSDWINDKPRLFSNDTETTGLDWFRPQVYPFMAQFCREPGKAIAVPLIASYYPELERDQDLLDRQIKQLMEDPTIAKIGHNFKFDYHMFRKLDIHVENWAMDTMQAAFAVDENIKNKSLDECVRLWVPEMAGYADEFNRTIDKDKMIEVEPEKILHYGCGDVDSCYQLGKVLKEEMQKDPRQYNLFLRVMMPGLRAFAETLEQNGVYIDEEKLGELGNTLRLAEQEKYAELIRNTPSVIKRKHLDETKTTKKVRLEQPEKILSFSRSKFIIDTLFTKEGFGLKPQVWTKGTKRLGEAEKIPSTSSKDHLPYFRKFTLKNGFRYIDELIDYQKLQKVRTTYVGLPYDFEKKAPTGFWQYINCGKINPSYDLSKTTTGRSNSRNPNGQNLPKRGQYAKAYRKIFVAPPGWKLVQLDYSQAELRLVAWTAQEETMLEAYRNGQDLHAITGAYLGGMTLDELMACDQDTIDDKRYNAKSANFGMVYGISWEGYQEYAYTQYNLILTDEQAQRDRSAFFNLYPGLLMWHEGMKQFVKSKGYVRALHGALRRLPDIYSNDRAIVSLAERQAINSPIQRFASDLGVMTLSRLHRDLKRTDIEEVPIKPCMFIHDALVALVRDDYLEEALPYLKFYMESNPLKEWFDLEAPIPIISDLEYGCSLGDLSKASNIQMVQPAWYTRD